MNRKTGGRIEEEREIERKTENTEGEIGEAQERKPEKQTDKEEHNRDEQKEIT